MFLNYFFERYMELTVVGKKAKNTHISKDGVENSPSISREILDNNVELQTSTSYLFVIKYTGMKTIVSLAMASYLIKF